MIRSLCGFDRSQDFDSIVRKRAFLDIRFEPGGLCKFIERAGCRATISQSNGYIIVPQAHADRRSMPRRWKLEKVGKKLSRRTKIFLELQLSRGFEGIEVEENDHVIDGEIGSHSFVCVCMYVCVSIGGNFGREFSRSRTNKSARYFNEAVAGSKSRSSSSTLSLSLSLSFVRSFFVAHFRILFPVISRRKVLLRIWWRVNSKQRIPRIEDVMLGRSGGR